jgi:hypothetical protein
MGVSHPTLWSFIYLSLHKIQSSRDTYYSQLEAGKSPPKKLKKYLDVDKRLKKIVSNYNSYSYISFLRGIAINLSLK